MTDLREAFTGLFVDEPPLPDMTDHAVAAGRRARGRRQMAVGLASTAVSLIVAAAVVVPLTLNNGASTKQSVVIADSASPTASPQPSASLLPGLSDPSQWPLIYTSKRIYVPIPHDGEYSVSTPSLPLSDGIPGQTVTGGHVENGTASIDKLLAIPEYTTSGTYLYVTFTADRVTGSPTYVIDAAASKLLPSDAATPTPTPSTEPSN
jgi:hypothetical protein